MQTFLTLVNKLNQTMIFHLLVRLAIFLRSYRTLLFLKHINFTED